MSNRNAFDDPGFRATLHAKISAFREGHEKRLRSPAHGLAKAQQRAEARADGVALLDALATATGYALLHVGKASRPALVQAPTSDDERVRAFVASIPPISCGDTERVASANLIKVILAAGPRRTLS